MSLNQDLPHLCWFVPFDYDLQLSAEHFLYFPIHFNINKFYISLVKKYIILKVDGYCYLRWEWNGDVDDYIDNNNNNDNENKANNAENNDDNYYFPCEFCTVV